MKNFNTDNAIGRETQTKIENFFDFMKQKKLITEWCNTEHFIFKHLGLDFECDYVLWSKIDWTEKTWGAEAKSVAGCGKGRDGKTFAYSSTVLEAWQDDAKTKRPGWWKTAAEDKLDYIYIENRYEEVIYCYDARVMYAWCQENLQDWMLTRCWQKGDDKGWIFKFDWMSKAHGFRAKYRQTEDGWEKIKDEPKTRRSFR